MTGLSRVAWRIQSFSGSVRPEVPRANAKLSTAEESQKPEAWVDVQRVPDSTVWKPPEWDDEEDGSQVHEVIEVHWMAVDGLTRIKVTTADFGRESKITSK